jgi:mutator protein MutT
VAAGVLEREGEILAAKRKRGSHLAGHWEFPGGKVEPDESPEDCLVRELAEEIGVRVRVRGILEVVFHRYPEKSVLLLFYRCDLLEGEPAPLECDEVRWVALADLPVSTARHPSSAGPETPRRRAQAGEDFVTMETIPEDLAVIEAPPAHR